MKYKVGLHWVWCCPEFMKEAQHDSPFGEKTPSGTRPCSDLPSIASDKNERTCKCRHADQSNCKAKDGSLY